MVIPAILEKEWDQIADKIEICRNFTRNLHIDFIDGKFSDNKTFFEFEPFSKYSSYFNLEAHLMVEEPIQYLNGLSKAGFKVFLGHVEKMKDQVEFVAHGETLGSVGLCLDLQTPTSEIKVPLVDLDRILLMSVPAGKSGQTFDEKILPKIKSLADGSYLNIEVDGGINDKTLPLAKQNGASLFCVTSFLFEHKAQDKFRVLQSLAVKD